jgi:hypothetical protein
MKAVRRHDTGLLVFWSDLIGKRPLLKYPPLLRDRLKSWHRASGGVKLEQGEVVE